MEDTRGFRLELTLDATRASQITLGLPADVTIGDQDDRTVSATVTEVARAVDPASATFVVKIGLPADPGLRSGLFGRARIAIGERQALTIPQQALVYQGQLPTVFVVTGEARARRRVLNVGDIAGGRVEVLSGLAPGEEVVAAPPPNLRDGDLIRRANAAAARGGTQ